MGEYKYNIIKCPYCKTLQYVKVGQKVRRCFSCKKILRLDKISILTRARDGKEASLIVRYLKAKEAGIADKLYGYEESSDAKR